MDKTIKKAAWMIFVAVVAAGLFFSALYRFDNKYTHVSPQPIGGVLDLSGGELSEGKICFPIYDWEFYGGELLTPDDFAAGRPRGRMEYLTIGERASMTEGSAFGTGTYRLNLVLPETYQTYMLYMPEVFNSYRLYINGVMMLDMGNIDTGGMCVQNRAVTFGAEGRAEIIIAVRSTSHFYSGMVYPPILGTPFSVNMTRGISLLAATATAVAALICFVLSLWLGFRMNRKHAKFFALICVAAAGYTTYNVIHTYIPVTSELSYTFEIGAYYAMFMFVLMLSGMICSIPETWKRINTVVSAAVLAAAVSFSVFSSHITVEGRAFLSWIFAAYKWFTAADLMAVVIFGLGQNRENMSRALIFGAVFFAAAVVFDRVYPVYEPIYGARFIEAGGIVFIVILGSVIWREIMNAYYFGIVFAEQKRQMERQLYMQKEHYEWLMGKVEETRRIRHDMRQHLRVMRELLKQEKYDELSEYIRDTDEADSDNDTVTICSNVMIDAVLQYYRKLSIKHGIAFEARFSAPDQLPVSDGDLSVLLGNLLENAYEACERQNSVERSISVLGICDERNFRFRIINTASEAPRMDGRETLSSKRPGVGIGLRSVRSVAEKYGGLIDIGYSDGKFTVSVIIPIGAAKNEIAGG